MPLHVGFGWPPVGFALRRVLVHFLISHSYFGPFGGFKAAAQIALGASGTLGAQVAQVAQTMLLARSLGRGGCPGQIYGEISLPGAQYKFEPLVGHKKRHLEACVTFAGRLLCPTRGSNLNCAPGGDISP